MPDEPTEELAPRPVGSRAVVALARRRRTRLLVASATLFLVSLAGVGVLAARNGSPPSTAAVTSTSRPHQPAACAEALSIGRRLAVKAGLVASAAGRHLKLMERLDRFLEGKPGGLSGHQVYELGEEQMAVFEKQGPDTKALAVRYQEVAKRCPQR